jgi:hypothetical protein
LPQQSSRGLSFADVRRRRHHLIDAGLQHRAQEEMRASGVRGLLIYCSDHKCSHSTTMSADRWSDDVRLSDIEPLFTCQACGERGADVRPNFHWEEEARRATISGRNTSGRPNR